MVDVNLIIGSVGVLFGIGVVFFRGFRILRDKTLIHDNRLNEHAKKITEMEKGFDDRIDRLEKKIDKYFDESRRSSENFQSEQSNLKSMISRIDGYIFAKKENA